MQKITPFLWFDNNAKEAMDFYASVFKDAKVLNFNGMTGVCEINGQRIMVMNAGPTFKLNEAFSFFVSVETQKEVDELWNKLTADGGQESQCGWLKDKFGLSWQIIPTALGKYLGDKDPQKSQSVMKAMLGMKKIDIEGLKKAYEGK